MYLIKNFALLAFILAISSQKNFSQSVHTTCKDLKDGKFFLYQKNSKDSMFINRQGNIQHQINMPEGDTTVWDVVWVNDCVYSLKFLSGGKNEALYKALNKKHTGLYEISSVTNDYYVYNFYLDSISDVHAGTDTIWLKQKTVDNRIFKKTIEENPSFAGGAEGWKNFITKLITKNIKALTRSNESGTCYVGFVVDADGSITNVEALTMEGSLLASISKDAIKKGPKWEPAVVDGKKVKFYQVQPVTFKIVDD